jgi:hypothetical protein
VTAGAFLAEEHGRAEADANEDRENREERREGDYC